MEIKFSDEVAAAISESRPVVALESTVIAHGLPYPLNLETGLKLESIIRDGGAVPTTIAMFGSSLYAVNARFATPPTPDTTYTIVRVAR